jgi:GNAT superfamily N-acetyltransferase
MTARSDSDAAVTTEFVGPEAIPLFEPLWKQLHEHHVGMDPHGGPHRSADESWRRRRAKYDVWLHEPDAFAVLARLGGEPIGYAVVHMTPGSESWQTGERIAEIETMCILPQHRSRGVGDRIALAMYERVTALGIDDAAATAFVFNEDAIRFFKRYGFTETLVSLRLSRARLPAEAFE